MDAMAWYVLLSHADVKVVGSSVVRARYVALLLWWFLINVNAVCGWMWFEYASLVTLS